MHFDSTVKLIIDAAVKARTDGTISLITHNATQTSQTRKHLASYYINTKQCVSGTCPVQQYVFHRTQQNVNPLKLSLIHI